MHQSRYRARTASWGMRAGSYAELIGQRLGDRLTRASFRLLGD